MGIVTINYSDADGLRSVDYDSGSTSIGRSPNQDVVLSDSCVSRHHAVIVREGDTYAVIGPKQYVRDFSERLQMRQNRGRLAVDGDGGVRYPFPNLPGAPSFAQAETLIQKLLADGFQLKLDYLRV